MKILTSSNGQVLYNISLTLLDSQGHKIKLSPLTLVSHLNAKKSVYNNLFLISVDYLKVMGLSFPLSIIGSPNH